jgi:hypothetical protein
MASMCARAGEADTRSEANTQCPAAVNSSAAAARLRVGLGETPSMARMSCFLRRVTEVELLSGSRGGLPLALGVG